MSLKAIISHATLQSRGRSSSVPHESEADLEGWRVVLKIDDDGEEERGDKVGQGDDNGGKVLMDEIHNKILLQTKTDTESIAD